MTNTNHVPTPQAKNKGITPIWYLYAMASVQLLQVANSSYKGYILCGRVFCLVPGLTLQSYFYNTSNYYRNTEYSDNIPSVCSGIRPRHGGIETDFLLTV